MLNSFQHLNGFRNKFGMTKGMDFFRKHKRIWMIIVAFASLALVVSSFLPLFLTR